MSEKNHQWLFWSYSSNTAWVEQPRRLQSIGSLRIGHNWVTSLSLFTSCIGEGNGNPLQCSCLENPRDGGAWWATVCGVAQSRTRLKWLSSSNTALMKTKSFKYWDSITADTGFWNKSTGFWNKKKNNSMRSPYRETCYRFSNKKLPLLGIS